MVRTLETGTHRVTVVGGQYLFKQSSDLQPQPAINTPARHGHDDVANLFRTLCLAQQL
jgi:hypothetical protein